MPSESPAKAKTVAASAKQASPESNVKETVESILVAFILAFIFRAFVVEAFVIPTGSMAPTLMGAHMRFRCPDCGYQFDVNFSNGNTSDDVDIPNYALSMGGDPITYKEIHCPNCGRDIPVVNPTDPDNDGTVPPVYYGDRILVLKYLYLFQAPHRWDVVVFKAPVDRAKTNYAENYIKRLVGLPGETIVILDGDVYVLDPESHEWEIQRKPYSVQRDLWRIVYDNDFIPQSMPNGGVPNQPRSEAWKQPWTPENQASGWTLTANGPDGKPLPDRDKDPSRVFTFKNDGAGSLKFDPSVNSETHAFTDWLPYDQTGSRTRLNPVSDLKLSCFYQRRSGSGAFSLELSKRDDTFTAEILPGRARLLDKRKGSTTTLFDVAVPDLNGTHPVQVEFANCDYRVWLRINDKVVFETTNLQYHPDVQFLLDEWQRRDELPYPGVRMLAQNQECQIEHLSLWHDIYYINNDPTRVIWAIPKAPSNSEGQPMQGGPMVLKSDPKEYFVMGDNSPISGDARMWTEDVHLPAERLDVQAGRVPEEFMLGKAFFVYWPAGYRPFSKNFAWKHPVPNPGIIPDFGDMRSIH